MTRIAVSVHQHKHSTHKTGASANAFACSKLERVPKALSLKSAAARVNGPAGCQGRGGPESHK